MTIGLKFGHQVIESYRRLSYTPWHALAEYVDNSTQAYEEHREELDRILAARSESFSVRIAYAKEDDLLRIYDNSSGMTYKELERALEVSRPPQNTRGRSRYGLGMKTASCWLRDHWTVRTKRLGEQSNISSK
jgi:hypothetical protein